jgi:hypothetical protein
MAATYGGWREGYDLVVGVNHVPARYECDWWVFNDGPMYLWVLNECPVIGRPRICSGPYFQTWIREEGARNEISRTRWESGDKELLFNPEDIDTLPIHMADFLPVAETGRIRWGKYTGNVALMLAWWLGADVMDVHGIDLDGDSDFQGTSHDTRLGGRWECERPITAGIVRALRASGVTVNLYGRFQVP